MIYIIALCNAEADAEDFRRSYQKAMGGRDMSEGGYDVSFVVLARPSPGASRKFRIVEMANYLRSPKCAVKSDQDIVIYVDVVGLLMMSGGGEAAGLKESAIREFLEAQKKSILFGASPFGHGLYPESVTFFEGLYPKEVFKFPSAGFVMGYKWAITQLYGHMAAKISYYPKSPDGSEVGEGHIIGNTYYQMISPQFALANKSLEHIKVCLDHGQRFFFQKGPKMALHEIARSDAPFLLFFGSFGGGGLPVIPHQRLDYACVVKLLGLV
jgi:hypothetical protein